MPSIPETAARALALAGACFLAGACASIPPQQPVAQQTPAVAPIEPPPAKVEPPPPPPPDPMAIASRRLLAWQERLRAMTPEQVASEVGRLGPAAEDSLATLELAMALARTRNAGDLQRAIALVEPIAQTTGEGIGEPARSWARLLATQFAERRRAEEISERQAQALREQQRRIDQLNGKLEALRAIERSLGAPR